MSFALLPLIPLLLPSSPVVATIFLLYVTLHHKRDNKSQIHFWDISCFVIHVKNIDFRFIGENGPLDYG